MNTPKYIIGLLSLAIMPMLHQSATAQSLITDSQSPIIVPASPTRTISYRASLGKVKIASSVEYTLSSDADWCVVTPTKNGFNYRVTTNIEKSPREAKVKIYNETNNITRYVSIVQDGSNFEKYVEQPSLDVVATDATAPGTSSLKRTIDGSNSTYYDYSAEKGTISETNPLNLDYTFGGQDVKYITYIPNGTSHGYMGIAKISYKKVGSENFIELGTYNLSTDGSTVRIELPDGGAENIDILRFSVWNGLEDGNGNEQFGCAEMQFTKGLNSSSVYGVFADELLTKLRPEITAEDIDTIANPFVQNLASQIYAGTYDTKYRAAYYNCLLPASSVGDTLLSSKNYDIFEGVTGIAINPGQFSVAVKGIQPGVTAQLYITAYRPKSGNTGPSYKLYTLKNGMNIINYTADSVGLAYVKYRSDTPEKYDSIGLHFINGVQNGYITNKMTNADIANVLQNAKYMCMDILGNRVHLVFESKSLLRYTAGRYRQLINVYDSIIAMEHRVLGLEKYNKIPKVRTLFYVNYDYFMYQTVLGASAKYDVTEILVPTNFLNKNTATIWGVAHEWGHQHQSAYYTWGGMAEVSNNIFSSYCCIHFGQKTKNFLIDNFAQAYKEYFEEDYFETHTDSLSPARQKAYAAAGNYSYSPKLQEAFLAMKDARIPSRSEDYLHTANFVEHNLNNLFSNRLASLYEIANYFEFKENNTEIYPNFFNDIRETERGTNKYELIAAAQNGKTARLTVLREMYPSSVWVTNNYVYEKSKSTQNEAAFILNFIYKMSTATGYNMFPYFEKWGYLRQIATYASDYGDHYYCLTKDMYDEFKADMDARVESGELKTMTDELIEEISSYPIPTDYPVLKVPN